MKFTDNQIQYKVSEKTSVRSNGCNEERGENLITSPLETEAQYQGSIKEEETRQKKPYKQVSVCEEDN